MMTKKLPIFLEAHGEALALARHFQPYQRMASRNEHGDYIVGYGHRFAISPGAEVTRDKAEDLLDLDLDRAREVLLMAIRVPIEQHEYEALLDFCLTIDARQFLHFGWDKIVNDQDHAKIVERLLIATDYKDGFSINTQKRRAAETYLYKNRKPPPEVI